MQTAAYIITVDAVLVGIGGLTGYLRAKSLPSLLMGSLSFLVLLIATHGMRTGQAWGLPLALALTLFLLVFFSLLALAGILLTKK